MLILQRESPPYPRPYGTGLAWITGVSSRLARSSHDAWYDRWRLALPSHFEYQPNTPTLESQATMERQAAI